MYQTHQFTDEAPRLSSDNVAGNNIYAPSVLGLNPFDSSRRDSDIMAIGVLGAVVPGPASEISTESLTMPPSSDESRPDNKETVRDVPTTFFPGMASLHHDDIISSDIILISSDNVQFHVHLHVLYDASSNGFASLLPVTTQGSGIPVLNIPEQSDILNIILKTIYGNPIVDYRPAFEVLVTAVDLLERYGIQPQRYVRPTQPLFELIRFHIPRHPFDIYVLAAHYDLFQLAEAASFYLLSTALDTITEAQSMRMGAGYLKRLYDLHSRRIDALKSILIRSPEPHPPTPTCSLSDQNGVSRAWALSAAYLLWDAQPGKYTA
ncbi:hypothetical protein IW261DRAFT_1496990 [Armillaria novae-zelandiae]|uniref:BTB domain-containing protein n=1 Tax=Armillaria novae-zelandiae TaxID=153914 RepID=A0AA39P069_9AGAR|nr:hypothetical protein IW261DRAFT_1496990 [Armillaria novae-zelandiae]